MSSDDSDDDILFDIVLYRKVKDSKKHENKMNDEQCKHSCLRSDNQLTYKSSKDIEGVQNRLSDTHSISLPMRKKRKSPHHQDSPPKKLDKHTKV